MDTEPVTSHNPDGAPGNTWRGPMLVDTHAHLYNCYGGEVYFDATLANFNRARTRLGLPSGEEASTPGCLLLVEPGELQLFDALLEQRELEGGRWRFIPCGDGLSLIAQKNGDDALLFIRGRQIQTRERLEVLSLCNNATIPDYIETIDALKRTLDQDGLPVLPIGGGKWLGSRGRFVEDIMASSLGEQIWLGDNAGRFGAGPTPRQFLQAKQLGRWVLPGSGTVAFGSQGRRVGRYGMLLDIQVDRDSPAASIKQAIRAGGEHPIVFGRPDSLINYVKCQSLMQIYGYMRGPNWYGREGT